MAQKVTQNEINENNIEKTDDIKIENTQNLNG